MQTLEAIAEVLLPCLERYRFGTMFVLYFDAIRAMVPFIDVGEGEVV